MGLRRLMTTWIHSGVRAAVHFTMDRLEEIDAELDEDDLDDIEDLEEELEERFDWSVPMEMGAGAGVSTDPLTGMPEAPSSDVVIEPDPSWIRIELKSQILDERVVRIDGCGEDEEPETLVMVGYPPLDDYSFLVRGIRILSTAKGSDDESAAPVVGLVRDLSVRISGVTKDVSYPLFLHQGFCPISEFDKLRTVREHPAFGPSASFEVVVAATGHGEVDVIVDLYLERI